MSRRDDQGSVTMFIAVLAVGFIAAAGLAYDGAQRLGGLSESRDLAANAARACAQGADTAGVRAQGTGVLDPTLATQRANEYLSSLGHTGSISVAYDECTVTVALSVPTRFLPGGAWTVSSTQSARPITIAEGGT